MLRMRSAWIPALIVLLTSLPSYAGWNEMKAGWHSYWNRVHVDWHRNNAWPEPFQTNDRQAVRVMLAAQTEKAWQLQTTLGNQYFDPETQQLNAAGQRQLYWIVSQAPESHRTVRVLRGHNDQATQVRMQDVERTMALMLNDGPYPAVVQSDLVPPAANGDRLDKMWEMRKNAVNAPALPAAGGR